MKKIIIYFSLLCAIFILFAFKTNAAIIDNQLIDSETVIYIETTDLTGSNVVSETTEKINNTTYRIYSQPKFYYDDTIGQWYDTKISTTTKFEFDILQFDQLSAQVPISFKLVNEANAQQQFNFIFDSGSVYKNNSSSWSVTHDATSGVTAYRLGVDVYTGNRAGPLYMLRRSFLNYDLSSIDISKILSGNFNFSFSGVQDCDNDGRDYLGVATTSQIIDNNLVVTDFPLIGSTTLTDTIDLTGKTTLTLYTLTFNAFGLDYLKSTSSPQLTLREGHDWENEAPTCASGQDVGGTIFTNYLELTLEEETPPEEEATSTTEITWEDDLSKIVAWEFTYDGTNTSATTSIKKTVYDIPFIKYLLLVPILLIIFNRFFKEFIIRLRQWTKK